MTNNFCDRFGHVSHEYSRYRPTYPADLFQWLASIAPSRSLAWDCATGSGQAAAGLVEYFDCVIATDASEEQLSSVTPHDRISYRQAMAERSGIIDASIDLITVAQALHWFDIPQFYAECARVLKPLGALAVWTYGPPRIENESINAILLRFYHEIIGDYWPPERAFVDTQYVTIKLPYPELQPPQFEMAITWTLDELLGYLGTWSSTSAYRLAIGSDPRELIETPLRREWTEANKGRKFEMPLTIRACKKLE